MLECPVVALAGQVPLPQLVNSGIRVPSGAVLVEYLREGGDGGAVLHRGPRASRRKGVCTGETRRHRFG